MVSRKKYSSEFKVESVKLVQQSGKAIITVAQDLGIHDSL
ncbi:transposase [Ferrovum sp. PN-J185]|nr:transposase [Ferrovum sp. PN-J185]MCC6069234.1 transposase [Ferrovum sp. PN-J185]